MLATDGRAAGDVCGEVVEAASPHLPVGQGQEELDVGLGELECAHRIRTIQPSEVVGDDHASLLS
jgi:hypothetical protein